MTIAEKLTRAKTDIDEVYEAGKKAEYDAFWDAFQKNGTRRTYTYAFSYGGFNHTNFYPKYDIILSGYTVNAFFGWVDGEQWGNWFNLKERLEECGVVLDTKAATNLTSMFGSGAFTEIPAIDLTGCDTNTVHVFYYCYGLKRIEKIITKENLIYTNWFRGDTELEDVTFEGIIGNTIDFQYSPLNKASITNIIEHLSTTASGKTASFKKATTEAAFATGEFEALCATRSNWTISLV